SKEAIMVRRMLALVLVAVLVGSVFVPAWSQEMVNGSSEPEPTVVVKPLMAVPLGQREIVIAWQITEGERSALVVLHIWDGGGELVVVPWRSEEHTSVLQ